MAVYKKLLPDKDYVKLEKSVNKFLKSLDKSVDLESDKLFDKIRDIQLGSAPVDLLSVIGSIGTVGWWLGRADNKDERISAALKYGIPAIGAVAISLYCTIGLISAGPSLLIGLASGLVINQLGEYFDNMRKKYKEKHPALTLPNINMASQDRFLKS